MNLKVIKEVIYFARIGVLTLTSAFLLPSCGVENGSSSISSSSSSSSSNGSSSSSSSSSSGVVTPPGSALVYAVNAGGSSVVVLNGLEYKADKFSSSGAINSTSDSIAGVAEQAVYQTERYGASFSYKVPVTNARYSVVMQFVEMYHDEAGLRSFSVSVEGQRVFENMDLYAQVGHDGALEYIMDNIEVVDGEFTIELSAQIDAATISGFAIYSDDGGEFVEPPEPELPDAGGPYFGGIADGESKFLGNIVANSIPSFFSTYWNQITMENSGKWEAVEPTRGNFNWTNIENTYRYANENGMLFKHHVFVWGSQEPAWIQNGGGLSSDEVKAEVEDFMKTYCERFPLTKIIDVVNEPLHAPATYRDLIGGDGETGWDWVVWSFEKARQYCPDQILVLNDYGIIQDPPKIERYKVIINALKDRGLIDAIGIQSHAFNLNFMTGAEVSRNLDNLAQVGLPIYVTEMDIQGSDSVQRDRFADIFPAFWEHPAVVGVTLWGDDHNWLGDDARLIVDGSPRPALEWMQSYFEQRRANR